MTGFRSIMKFTALCLAVVGLAGPATAVTIGTPPAAGQIIEEVATSTVSYGYRGQTLYPGLTGEWILELPLPVFASTGQAAEPEQCLWSANVTGFYYEGCDPEVEFLITELEYVLGGSTLYVYAGADPTDSMHLYLSFAITAVAIRTTEPVGAETTTIGRVKELYR